MSGLLLIFVYNVDIYIYGDEIYQWCPMLVDVRGKMEVCFPVTMLFKGTCEEDL